MARSSTPAVVHESVESAKANPELRPAREGKESKPLNLYTVTATGAEPRYLYATSPLSAAGRLAMSNGYTSVATEPKRRAAITPMQRVTKTLDQLTPEEKQALIQQLLGQSNPAESAPVAAAQEAPARRRSRG